MKPIDWSFEYYYDGDDEDDDVVLLLSGGIQQFSCSVPTLQGTRYNNIIILL